MATTLGEILEAKGDADYAQGGYGGAIPDSAISNAAANEYLQHNADLTYQAHRYLAEQHDQNMRETLKGLNDVDFKDLLPQDSASLMPEYTGVLQDTANNFGVIRNPLSNPQQYAALKANESNFRQKLSQAQQDAEYLRQQQNFVQLHPEFNTPAFQQNVKDFLAAPVGQRQHFVVTPPLTFNPATTYKTIAELAKKKYANSGTNGKYITQEEGEKIDPTQYQAIATGPLPGTDQYGNSLEAARRASFDSLPANLKSQYKDYNDYVAKQAALYMPQDQVSKSELKPDEYGTINAQGIQSRKTMGMSEAFQAHQNDLDRQNQLIIAGLKKNEIDPTVVADNNMRTAALIEKTGNIPENIGQALYGDNSPVDVKIKSTDDQGREVTKNVKLPALQFVNSGIDENGNLHVYMKDNATGKMLPNAKIISHQDLLNDLNNQYGKENKPKIEAALSKFSQDNFGKPIPGAVDLLEHYKLGSDVVPTTRINSAQTTPVAKRVNFGGGQLPAVTPAVTGGLSNDAYQEFLNKNGLLPTQ